MNELNPANGLRYKDCKEIETNGAGKTLEQQLCKGLVQ